MGHIIAIANQKGGVGKTTSAVSLASEFSMMGYSTLLVDFDPQGNATSGLGVAVPPEGEDLYDMFFGKISLSSILRQSVVENLHVAPSSQDLVAIEVELGKQPGRELILRSELELLRGEYDFIIIDCPPSSGLLTLNAMGAAELVLIPLQAEYYALEGLTALMRTVEFVQQTFNPNLELLGVFLTMYDSRTNLSSQVEAEVREYFSTLTLETKIPRNIRLSEAPSHGVPIALYDPSSAGAKAYNALALELKDRLALDDDADLVANS